MACVFVELGQEVHIQGDFEQAVHEGVRRGYGEGYLRKSMVARPPAPGEHRGQHPRRHHPPAGAWGRVPDHRGPQGLRQSENMSRLGMLKPADGVEGVKKFVVETVRPWPAPTPVPPSCWASASAAPLTRRPIWPSMPCSAPSTSPTPTPSTPSWSEELLEEINALGIGPQGFGGTDHLLWALAIETAPTHVAGLPVAVNVSCHVTRRASSQL